MTCTIQWDQQPLSVDIDPPRGFSLSADSRGPLQPQAPLIPFQRGLF